MTRFAHPFVALALLVIARIVLLWRDRRARLMECGGSAAALAFRGGAARKESGGRADALHP